MADPTKRNGENGRQPSSSDDANLSARLKSLDARLDQAAAQRSETKEPRTRSTSDASAIGRAFQLSAEFVAGFAAVGYVGRFVEG